MSQLLAFVRGKNWAAVPQCFGRDLDGQNPYDGFVEQDEALEDVTAFTGLIAKAPKKTVVVWFAEEGQVPTHIVVTKCLAVMKKKPAVVKKSKGRKAY